jgi:putative addiction module component (TIGR02574 family)
MPQNPQQIIAHALEMPAIERGRLAALLIDSLEAEPDEAADASWAAEIQRRIAEIDSGRVQLVPWSEVRRLMRDTDHDGD